MGHLKLEVSFLSYLAKGGVGRGILSEAPPTVQREELGLCSFRFLSKLLVKRGKKVNCSDPLEDHGRLANMYTRKHAHTKHLALFGVVQISHHESGKLTGWVL